MKNDIPIYAIDFEGSKTLGIVEFGIVGILDGEIFESHSAICSPKKQISKTDAKFFDISNELANRYAPFESHCDLFSSLRSNGIFAAHNFATEDSLIRSHIPSPGRVKNHFTSCDTLTWSPWLDSRIFAKFLNPSLESEKLSDVIASLNLNDELQTYAQKICKKNRAKWHRALFDALASALIIKSALSKIKDINQLKILANIKDSDDELF